MEAETFYGIQLEHWMHEPQEHPLGVEVDYFCVMRLYHITVTRDVPTEDVGWHISVRPFCSEPFERRPTVRVARKVWYPDVVFAFQQAGVEFYEGETTDAGVVHFYEKR